MKVTYAKKKKQMFRFSLMVQNYSLILGTESLLRKRTFPHYLVRKKHIQVAKSVFEAIFPTNQGSFGL